MDENKQQLERVKQGKLHIELKQNPKGVWYAHTLNINADTIEEFDKLLGETSKKLKEHLKQLNSQVKQEIAPEIVMDPESLKVFQNLKELRRLLAKREGNPPYMIFHDSILRKVARERPRTDKHLIDLIGQKKFDRYGSLVVEVLDAHRTIF